MKKKNDEKILIVNIGRNDNNLRILDIAKIIKDLVKDTKISFLRKKKQSNDESLFLDRKIKEGRDSRTYKVSFERSEKNFGFKCKFTVKDGVAKMIEDFENIKLDEDKFKFKGFYRLQYLEDLYEKNLIDENLKWKI